MEDFIELNRKYLYDKLDSINCNNQIYIVNDIIDVLSSTPPRDRSRINKYPSDLVYIGYAKRDNCLRQVRLFTEAGLLYYLNDGNITNYIDACSYFNVPPIDLLYKKYKEQFDRIINKCVNGKFKTSILLSWLYDKIKNIVRLPTYIDIDDVLEFIINYNTSDTINKKKYNILISYNKTIKNKSQFTN
jgi:hypothetical protein